MNIYETVNEHVALITGVERFLSYLETFENRMLRKHLDLGGMKLQKAGENCTLRSFVIPRHTLHQILLVTIESTGMRTAGHVPLMGDLRNAYRISVRKPEGMRLF
jgi:hypothetical protein